MRSRFRIDRFILRISQERERLKGKSAILRASEPRTILNRGFSLVFNEDMKLIKSVSELKENQVIRAHMKDGDVTGTVRKIETKHGK